VVDVEAEARRAAVRFESDGEARCGARVGLQDAADLPVHGRLIEPFLRAREPGGEAFQRLIRSGG